MIVSTDDASRWLRYIYLGPRGWRFPFDARIPALALCVFLTAVLSGLAFAVAPTTRLGGLGCAVAFGVSVWATRKIMRHVTPDQPLRWWAVTVQAELDTPRPLDTDDDHEHLLTVRSDLFDQGIAA